MVVATDAGTELVWVNPDTGAVDCDKAVRLNVNRDEAFCFKWNCAKHFSCSLGIHKVIINIKQIVRTVVHSLNFDKAILIYENLLSSEALMADTIGI